MSTEEVTIHCQDLIEQIQLNLNKQNFVITKTLVNKHIVINKLAEYLILTQSL